MVKARRRSVLLTRRSPGAGPGPRTPETLPVICCTQLMLACGRRSPEQGQSDVTPHLVEPRGTRCPPLCFMPTRASSECSLLLPQAAMATRLLCWVALCLLGIGESPEIKNLHFVDILSSVSIYVPYPVPKLCPLPQSPHMLESPRHPGTR